MSREGSFCVIDIREGEGFVKTVWISFVIYLETVI